MRKMSRIFTGLLSILFITGLASAQFQAAFTVVDTIIGWGSAFYGMEQSLTDKTGENVEEILQKVNKLSVGLENFESHISAQLDTMLNTLLNDIETTTELQGLKSQLLPHLYKVDQYFHDSLKYLPHKSYANRTLEQFTERVLYGTDDLVSSLTRIHEIFIPGVYINLNAGYVPLFIKKTMQNLPTDCQRSISPQQTIFYIYVQLIMAEMKALATFKNVYDTKSWLENFAFAYNVELNDALLNFDEGVKAYYKIITQQLALLPRHLYRCHVNTPKRDADYFELVGLSRIKFLMPSFIMNPGCRRCPDSEELADMSDTNNIEIYNCKLTSDIITVCPAESESSRDYLWWQDEAGTYYGDGKTCPRETTRVEYSEMPLSCGLCYCSMDQVIRNRPGMKPWRISVRPQISDIWNNKVVTGVQFIRKNKMIHLQIQQGKFSNTGVVYSDVAWKSVNPKYYNRSEEYASEVSDGRLGAMKKTIFLDDIMVPKGSVVTGVKFERYRRTPDFRLLVQATEFDFVTGKLNPSVSRWCAQSECEEIPSTSDYERERIEIDMGEANDPTKGAEFHYDMETNKMITFKHTDVYKDGGQTTVPFFDSQRVQAQPSFPLSGIGLYYRGRDGFGGYIAPRIFTLDVTQYMATPSTDIYGQPITTTTEEVEWEVVGYDKMTYEPDGYLAYRVD